MFDSLISNSATKSISIKPIGREVVVEKKEGNIEITREWLNNKTIKLNPENIRIGKIADGKIKGVVTILKNDYLDINHRGYEMRNAVFSTPNNAINALLGSKHKYLTFLQEQTHYYKNIHDLFDYIFNAIESGIFIDTITLNGISYYLTNMKLRAVYVKQGLQMTGPHGALLRTVVGSENSNISNGVFTYTHNIIPTKSTTRALVSNGEVILLEDFESTPAIDVCPVCSNPVKYKNEVAFCNNVSCSSILESFLSSISEQTGIELRDLIDYYNSSKKFQYPSDATIEAYERYEIPVSILRTFLDVFGKRSLMPVLKFLFSKEERIKDTLFDGLLVLFGDYVSNIYIRNDVDIINHSQSLNVLIAGDFDQITDQAVSLMLASVGLNVTENIDEALFVIHGGGDTEYLDYIRDTTNIYILDVSNSPETLSEILKNI